MAASRCVQSNRLIMVKPAGGGRSTGGKKRVKTARKRSAQSTRWLERQLNDPYVRMAKDQGYRSRAAFKLIELDEKFSILKGKKAVIDLGLAPGGWAQYIRRKNPNIKIVGIDLLPVDPIEGVKLFEMDFMDDKVPDILIDALGQTPDLIISDMAANTVGHKQTDHLRTMGLVEAAAHFAIENLSEGGDFLCKVFAGGTHRELLTILKKNFMVVKHAKPPSSRKGSVEGFVFAKGLKAEMVNSQVGQ